jgi:hypothetical protein
MAVRTLRRKVIIREYDFVKVREQAFTPLLFESLYDRAEFLPLKKDDLEKQNLLKIMKEPEKSNPFKPTEIPALFLFNVKDFLYNEKYIDWNAEYDDEGYIWVQARKNTPRSRLGWAVFEKDLVSRL